ncbi:hypothetical protein NL676_030599 [Syzygium grande]|nr:hypothetical protein NL676_030599 [Syzygium grande]
MKVPSWTRPVRKERCDPAGRRKRRRIKEGQVAREHVAASSSPEFIQLQRRRLPSDSVAAYPPPVQGAVPHPPMPPVLPPPGPHPRGISAEAISAAGAISPVGISTAGVISAAGGHIHRRRDIPCGYIRRRGISPPGSYPLPGAYPPQGHVYPLAGPGYAAPLPAHQTSNYGGNFLQPFMGRLAANVIADGVWAVLGSSLLSPTTLWHARFFFPAGSPLHPAAAAPPASGLGCRVPATSARGSAIRSDAAGAPTTGSTSPGGISAAEAISAAGAISTAGGISAISAAGAISTVGAYPPPGPYPPPAEYPLQGYPRPGPYPPPAEYPQWVRPPPGAYPPQGHVYPLAGPGYAAPLPAHQTSNYGGNFLRAFMGRLPANAIADGVWAVLGSVNGP